jgi:hypothetical protein
LTAANSSNPVLLITFVSAAATAFYQEHGNNRNYITSVANYAGNFVLWARGIKAGCVTATNIMFDPSDTDIECFKIEQHQACIHPFGRKTWVAIRGGLPPPPAVVPSNMAVLALLNTTISRQLDKQEDQNNKILTKQLKHMIKKDGTEWIESGNSMT